MRVLCKLDFTGMGKGRLSGGFFIWTVLPTFTLTQQDVLPVFIGASFASGLNVYATVATLGLLSHTHFFQLPQALRLVGTWPVILICAVLFALEFILDKIPALDLVWNALQTFVRIPVAAFLSYGATQSLSPAAQLGAGLLGAAIALAAHGGKTAVRAAVTPSPEPVSNMALSLGEDVLAVSLTWFATQHPIAASAIVAILLLIIVFTIRYVVRSTRRLFQQMRASFSQRV